VSWVHRSDLRRVLLGAFELNGEHERPGLLSGGVGRHQPAHGAVAAEELPGLAAHFDCILKPVWLWL